MDSPTERDKLFGSFVSQDSTETVDLQSEIDVHNQIIGRSILLNPDEQHHKIIEISRTTRNVNTNLTKSNSILRRMINASTRTKCIGIAIISMGIFIIVIIIYLKLNRS
jgi:hypothetical protein